GLHLGLGVGFALGHLGLALGDGIELRLDLGFALLRLFGLSLLLLFLLLALLGRDAAQLRDLALRELGVDAGRELLDVELEVVRVVAVLDRAPEFELDFLAGLRAGVLGLRLRRRCGRARRRRGDIDEIARVADDRLLRVVLVRPA